MRGYQPDHNADYRAEARRAFRALPNEIANTTLTCPLCGTDTTARGLRRRLSQRHPPAEWQLVFTCPGCGLVSSFYAPHAAIWPIGNLPGSAWTRELRQYRWTGHAAQLPQERAARPGQLAAVFMLSAATWLLLTGSFNPVDLLWGAAVSALVARFSYRLAAFGWPRWVKEPRRWAQLGLLLLEFNRQLIIQNVTLAWRVMQPKVKVRPGIVAVPTRLRSDVALTVLGSLMTLTPDTVTMEIDQVRGVVYVHWIEVQATDPEKSRQLISKALEDRIAAWLL
jgi:multicomponent Na+:H+ antiporter subunit E